MTDIGLIENYDEVGGTEEYRDTYAPIGPNDLYVEPKVVFVRDVGSDQFTFQTLEVPTVQPGFAIPPRPIQISPRLESGIAHRVTVAAVSMPAGTNVYLLRSEEDGNIALSGTNPYCPHGFFLPFAAASSIISPLQFVTSAPLWIIATAPSPTLNPLVSVALETFYGRS